MNKNELAEAVAQATGKSKKLAGTIISTALDEMARTLAAGGKVSLSGFGAFGVRERPAHEGRNPRTKERVQIEASKAPCFKPGNLLKDSLNN